MQYVSLGRTPLQASRLCLGTMTFGQYCDEPTSHAIWTRRRKRMQARAMQESGSLRSNQIIALPHSDTGGRS